MTETAFGVISDRGYWIGEEVKTQHAYDAKLGKKLVEFFHNELGTSRRVVDLGCGTGSYVREFIKNGINADGFDGNPQTPELSGNTCGILDLSTDINLSPYHWVMSLEVGEHLPKEYEDIFIRNIHNTAVNGVILSWAVEGQGGHGHVNCRNNDYIKQKFADLGYINDIDAENALRRAASLMWFKKTIMVFRKQNKYSFC